MGHKILEQMAFSIDLLLEDARTLNHKFLMQILSMAAVEVAEARKQPASAVVPVTAPALVEEQDGPEILGSWRWDVANDRAILDPDVAKAANINSDVGANGVPLSVFVDAVHPLDRARVEAAFARAVSHDEPIHIVFRVRPPCGHDRRIFAVGRAVFEEGRAKTLTAVLMDVSEGGRTRTQPKPTATTFRTRQRKAGAMKSWLV